MKVSKQSWHYKLYKFLHTYTEPKGLCGYFWSIVISSFIVLCAIGLILFTIGSTIYLPIYLIFFSDMSISTQVVVSGIIGFGAFSVILYMYMSYLANNDSEWQEKHPILSTRIRFKFKNKNRLKTKKYKEPGLIYSYIKAKKNKVCPRIEVID